MQDWLQAIMWSTLNSLSNDWSDTIVCELLNLGQECSHFPPRIVADTIDQQLQLTITIVTQFDPINTFWLYKVIRKVASFAGLF